MYIEDRLFSEYDGERLYSVVMNEDEYALYSEFQKKFSLKGIFRRGLKKVKRYFNGIGKEQLESAKKARRNASELRDLSNFNAHTADISKKEGNIPVRSRGELINNPVEYFTNLSKERRQKANKIVENYYKNK